MGFEYQSAVALLKAIAQKEVGSLELLELFLERVGRLNSGINAVVALDEEGARRRAREADEALARGRIRGVLHGLPMTIKDTFEVVGLPATAGAPELKDHRPQQNALAVQRLIEAGAVIFGKTNTPLMAMDFQTYNEVYGTTNNPWNPARVPGGSSGGAAAALAAGLTALELGSDIGGSIRNPAHFCGVYGHKPSYGLIPLQGHIPGPPGTLSRGDLAVAGPLARSAEDLELALRLLAGPDPLENVAWRLDLPEPRRQSLGSYRVAAWLHEPTAPVDNEMLGLLEGLVARLSRAGVTVDEEARPAFSFDDSFRIYHRLLNAAFSGGQPPERYARLAKRARELPNEDQSLTARTIRAMTMPHREWMADNEARARLRHGWAEFFRRFDVLLCPVVPVPAFPHDHTPQFDQRTLLINGQPRPYMDMTRWISHATAAYLPATVAPLGLTSAGLPVGVQIVGPYLEDLTPIDFARRLGEVTEGFVAPPGY
jgi:amidase